MPGARLQEYYKIFRDSCHGASLSLAFPLKAAAARPLCHYPARFKTACSRAFRAGCRALRQELACPAENGRDHQWQT